MAARTPLEVGTRGTIGYLIMKEIEYFSQLELNCRGRSETPWGQFTATTSITTRFWTKLRSLITIRKKKKRGGANLVPNSCSVVEVVDSHRPKMIPQSNYRNSKKLHV
ncbi:hypothetical protein NMG60_11002237 [Bertholletia excelsa]